MGRSSRRSKSATSSEKGELGFQSKVGPRGIDKVVDGGEGAAEVVDEFAEVGASLIVGGVGPQEIGEMTARLGLPRMQHEVRQQRLRSHRGKTHDR